VVRRQLTRTGDRLNRLAVWLLLAGLVGGCVVGSPSPTPTAAPPTPTGTVAFPTLIPTSTSTPGASPTPTVDPRADVGALLLNETFDDGAEWVLAQAESGGSSVEGGRLSISVREPRAFQFATRQGDSYGDALVEVDVYTELCAPGDEFGLMFRVNSLGEHYRFVMGCDAAARASRALETGSRALTWWMPNASILPASPVHNHLALHARGDTFRFFVNDVEIFAVRDVSLASGRIGFLARAGSTGQVSVSFDDLIVRALEGDRLPTVTTGPTPIP
jgi:hypothetical protein